MRTEEEVDLMIENMIAKTKGNYITQACAFNKKCPRQMKMLKQALIDSVSFSGLVKEMIALRFDEKTQITKSNTVELQQTTQVEESQHTKHVKSIPKAMSETSLKDSEPILRSVGNFM